jgi:hypothetical protein
MIDNYGWQGIVKVQVKQDGVIVEEKEIYNRVMNLALDEFIKVLYDNPDMNIEYLALGTDNTAVADNQTKLVTEIFRCAYVSRTKTATGELTTVFVVNDSEAVATLEEIGIFCGSSASATVDTGTMSSRILWHRAKTANEEIQFTRIDRIVRA